MSVGGADEPAQHSGPAQHSETPDSLWWKSGVLYQVYPRSYADSNGDGVGDLKGLTSHLDHLAWLGIDGIWISPTTPSPNKDWGYDVADYCGVDTALGTLEDLDVLVEQAGKVGIRILLDLVPNHTSDKHTWFEQARADRNSRYRDYYVWQDPSPDGSLPNNWASSFGGPAWTLDQASGQLYLHNFLAEQPDLNWWNEEVRDEFDKILRFWFDRGIAGFRIDVCHAIIKDAELRDNPPADENDPFMAQVFGQKSIYNCNRPEVHDVLRRWRRIANEYDPPRLLLGETNVDYVEDLPPFYGTGDELQLGFNFQFIDAPFDTSGVAAIHDLTLSLLPDDAWPVWTGSNHDTSRLTSRWAGGDVAKIRLALLMLLTMRGTPVLYQGDEIGQVDTKLTREDLLDPVGIRFWPAYAGRDPVRTPMHWTGGPGAGFTEPGVSTWLPLGDAETCNVADERGDPRSVLNFVHDVIALRRRSPDLQLGPYERLPAPEGCWVWRRGSSVVVALNMSDEEVTVSVGGLEGRIAILSGGGDRAGEAVDGSIFLPAWAGAVVETA